MQIIKLPFLGLTIMFLVSCIPQTISDSTTPTSVVSHEIAAIENIESIWNISNVNITRESFCPELSAGMGKVCYIGIFGEPQDYEDIVCLASNTGTFLWQEEAGITPNLIVTSVGIFMTYSRMASPSWLAKLDPQNGDLVWRNDLGSLNSVLFLSYINNQIQLYTDPDDHFWIIDPGGNLVKKVFIGRTFALMPDETYNNLTGINAYKTDTNKFLWEHNDRIELVPLFTQDKIFLRNGPMGGVAKALNRKTGKLLWSTPDIIISNLAYSPEKKLVYALRQNGDLIGIDENSGTENVIARFSSAPFIVNGGEFDAFEMAYDEEEHIIIVSLGDSRQLFAFKEK